MTALDAGAPAAALDLALEGSKGPLECQPRVVSDGVGVELRPARNVDGHRATKVDTALRAILVAELNTDGGGRDLKPRQGVRDLARDQRA
jgi:hypothetical protein